MSQAPEYGNLIGGEWVPARSGQTFASVSPADDLLRGRKEDLARLMTREMGIYSGRLQRPQIDTA